MDQDNCFNRDMNRILDEFKDRFVYIIWSYAYVQLKYELVNCSWYQFKRKKDIHNRMKLALSKMNE